MVSERPRRRRLRLADYDYTQPGAYFVTICTERRRILFGDVVDGEMTLNHLGSVARDAWVNLPDHYCSLSLDEFVVMPNHVQGIVVFDAGAQHPLSEVVRGFKTFSAKRINELRNSRGEAVWQRGFYDHVVRDEQGLARIRDYIVNNPAKWDLDEENPARVNKSSS